MKLASVIALTSALAVQGFSQDFVVDAMNNASNGGTGLQTVYLTAGESFSVTCNPTDLWSLGALPRWCNADGLTGNLYATGTDESGQPSGTLIGEDFGLWTQSSVSLPYGEMVGQIGSGTFFGIGTSYSGVASSSGFLNLYCWDSYAPDNTNSITADVMATPEPAPIAAMALGCAMFLRRRRKA